MTFLGRSKRMFCERAVIEGVSSRQIIIAEARVFNKILGI